MKAYTCQTLLLNVGDENLPSAKTQKKENVSLSILVGDGNFHVSQNTTSAMISSENVPTSLVRTILKEWYDQPRSLKSFLIITRSTHFGRKELIEELLKTLPLKNVKQITNGKPASRQKAKPKSDGEHDLVDIYVLHPKDSLRMAIVSVSDVAIYINFGTFEKDKFSFLALTAEDKSERKKMSCVDTVGEKIYLIDSFGKLELYQSGDFEKMDVERIDLDHEIFGQAIVDLLPFLKTGQTKISEETQNRYRILMKNIGLPLFEYSGALDEENCRISDKTRCLMFGCKYFPMKLLENILKEWICQPKSLNRVLISRRSTVFERRKLMEDLSKTLPLIHVWNQTNHQKSVFRMKDIFEYKKNCEDQDLVDIYALFSTDSRRMVTLAVSDVALSLHFGTVIKGTFSFPVMKSAFAEVTKSNHFYEIDKEMLKKMKSQTEGAFTDCEIVSKESSQL